MNLNSIKVYVYSNLDVKHEFKYIGFRNQIECFSGFVNKCYSNIFTIICDDGSIRSFSYNDIAIKNLIIK